MSRNSKRLLIGTILELAVRTSSKVAIRTTKRGFGELTPEMYAEAQLNLKNELKLRGLTNV